jgi:dephospho-CoA kinase
MKYNIGLTGLIGSGKSTVANFFLQLGATVIDTDLISHKLTTNNGFAVPIIQEHFGPEFITPEGSINRIKMRDLIFTSPSFRIKLEEILHPMIFAEVVREIELSTTPYNIIVVPLLFRSKRYTQLIQRSIFVDCAMDTIIKRVEKRSGLNKAQIESILATQVTREEQISLADDIIENSGDEEQLLVQVTVLDRKYRTLCHSYPNSILAYLSPGE